MPKINQVLEKMLITEKSTKAKDSQNKYTFRVRNGSSQGTVAAEVEKAYKVDVLNVNLMIMPGKKRRLSRTSRFIRLPKWKKATVTLKDGQKIDQAQEVKQEEKEQK